MDSSYGNGGQNIPGAKPGVIASGPDAPDIPGVTLESENPNGVLSKLSRKTGGSKMPLIDGGGGPKQSKKGLLFVGVALIGVALIIGIVTLVLMGRGGGNNNGASVNVSLGDLVDYVENGKGFVSEDGDEEVKGDYVYAIEIGEDGTTTMIERYYTGLMEKIDAVKDDSEVAKIYLSDLKMLNDIMNNENVAKGLYLAYDENGDNGVNEYFENNIPCQNASETLVSICETVELYYERLLSEHKVYATAGCIKNGDYDNECALTRYGAETLIEKTGLAGVSQNLLRSLKSESTMIVLNATLLSAGQNVSGDGV